MRVGFWVMERQEARKRDRGERGGRSENESSWIRIILLLASVKRVLIILFFQRHATGFRTLWKSERGIWASSSKKKYVSPQAGPSRPCTLKLCSLTIPTKGISGVGSLHLPADAPPFPPRWRHLQALCHYRSTTRAHLRGRLLLARQDP